MSGRRQLRKQRRRQPRTLRTRLVVASVVLIAVVCAVIGTVTTIALRSHLYEQLGDSLEGAAMRAAGPLKPVGDPSDQGRDDKPKPPTLSELVMRGPQPSNGGTLAAKLTRGGITEAKVGKKSEGDGGVPQFIPESLTSAQEADLEDVPRDGKQHTVDLPVSANTASSTRTASTARTTWACPPRT